MDQGGTEHEREAEKKVVQSGSSDDRKRRNEGRAE